MHYRKYMENIRNRCYLQWTRQACKYSKNEVEPCAGCRISLILFLILTIVPLVVRALIINIVV